MIVVTLQMFSIVETVVVFSKEIILVNGQLIIGGKVTFPLAIFYTLVTRGRATCKQT